MSLSSLYRWGLVGLLLIAAISLTSYFVIKTWFKPPRLPVFVFSIGAYDSPELLGYPYGNEQRREFRAVNPTNARVYQSVQNDNDYALKELNNADWLKVFNDFKSLNIQPGGPDESFVLFYVSAYARIGADSQLMVYSQADNPYAGLRRGAQAQAGIPLEAILTNLGKAVGNGGVAWIVLDLQPPLWLADTSYANMPWKQAAQRAISLVPGELQSRLLVTLPCDDWQENWIAPEFSGTFFGHYFREVLSGMDADNSFFNQSICLRDFRERLDRNVANAVSNYRYAEQNPVWLSAENIQRWDGLRLVTSGSKSPKAQPASLASPETAKYWHGLLGGDYQRPYRWDPVGTAAIEMQLLALEDIAIYLPADYQQAMVRVENTIQRLLKPKVDFEVSLIEDHRRQLYFHGRSDFKPVMKFAQAVVDGLSESPPRLPEFWKSRSAGSQDESPVAGLQSDLSPDERSMLVWDVYAKIAASHDSSMWEFAFKRERLRAAIDYSDQADRRLEICLLERIAESIDWAREDDDRAGACAATLSMFARIQRMGSNPDPQVSWWLETSLPEIERPFLHATDYLLAGDSAEALSRLATIRSELEQLETEVLELQRAVEVTKHALHDLPYYVQWLLAEYQFAAMDPERVGRLGQIEQLLEELGKSAKLTQSLHRSLSTSPAFPLDVTLLDTSERLQSILEHVQKDFDRFVRERTAITPTARSGQSPETFRCERLALHMPMLPVESRQQLQQNTRAFLSKRIGGTASEEEISIPPQRDLREVFESRFLQQISENRQRWEWLALQDARFQLPQFFEAFEQPASSSLLEFRSSALSMEFWQRLFASKIGSNPTLINQLESDQAVLRSPWSVALQRWSLAEANRRAYQVQRLATASWGNATYEPSTPASEFLFGRLAKNYRTLPPPFNDLEPLKRFRNELLAATESSLASAAQRLQRLQVQYGDPNQTVTTAGEQKAYVRVRSADRWQATAQVLLGSPQARLSWVRDDPLPLQVDLANTEDFQRLKGFDASHWNNRPPIGTLLIRGNQLRETLDWDIVQTKRRLVKMTLEPPRPTGAQVIVEKPSRLPEISVLFLIDCSNSMSTRVDVTEGGQKKKKEVFALVKATAVGVLNKLQDIHGNQANINLGLIPIGIDPKILDSLRKQTLIFGPGDGRRIKPLNNAWEQEIRDAIEALQASLDTPLYDTIALAVDLARQRSDQRVFLYAFTDGVNYVSDEEKLANSKTHRDVKSLLAENPDIQLNIFHFDFFKSWVAGINRGKNGFSVAEQRAYWQKVQEDGIANLEELNELGSEHYLYARSTQANDLMQRSLETIPRSRVSIRSKANATRQAFELEDQSLGDRIDIPQQYLPNVFDVRVDGAYGQAAGQIEAVGGEWLQLRFDSRSDRLMFPEFVASDKLEPSGKPTGAGLSSEPYVKTFVERLHRGRLGLALSFSNGSQTEFTRRPRFIVGEASPGNSGTGLEPMILADHFFSPGTHYPEARVSDIPWLADQRPPVRLRVWASDAVPADIRQETLEPDQPKSISLGLADLELVHSGRQVTVEVSYRRAPPRSKDRVVLIVPRLAKSERSFDSVSFEETHRFDLPTEESNQPVVVQMATVEQLEDLAIADKLEEFEFSSIALPER